MTDGRGGRGLPMACADCASVVTRRSPSQRYCPACSGARDDARKAAWAAANDIHKTSGAPSAIKAAGAARAERSRSVLAHSDHAADYSPHTIVRVAVPFDWAASKNAVWRMGRGGHVYARSESTAFRSNLTAAIAATPAKWFTGKVWIDIFVEKPNHKGDATNMVDVICDAVKDAIGVDDRWYSLRRVDWAIVKVNPRIHVEISQDVTEDLQVCSHCGRTLQLDAFSRNRAAKNGRSRSCRECEKAARLAKKAAA